MSIGVEYFGDEAQRYLVRQALELTETIGRYNLLVNVSGGGITGQASAIRHGVARALLKVPEADYRPTLKKAGLLTRDAREGEGKK